MILIPQLQLSMYNAKQLVKQGINLNIDKDSETSLRNEVKRRRNFI